MERFHYLSYAQKRHLCRGTKNAVKHERHPLIGKLECGRCHRSLRIARTKNPYFFCSNRYVTRYEGYVRQINVQFLEQYLLFRLQEEADKQADIQRVLVKANDEAKAAGKDKAMYGYVVGNGWLHADVKG